MRPSDQRNDELVQFWDFCQRLAPNIDLGIELEALDGLSESEIKLRLAEVHVAIELENQAIDDMSVRELKLTLTRLRQSLQLSEKDRISLLDPPPAAYSRPPAGAEYLLFLLLNKKDRDVVIGDLSESYPKVLRRFDKRRADFWYCKEVASFLFPQLRRAFLKIAALVWLGRILRRLIS